MRSIDDDEQAVEQFVREASSAEAVWGIQTPHGFAVLPADCEYASIAILFWSSEQAAATAAHQFNEGGSAAERMTFS
ncbi:MAG: hypothetical protein AB7K24_18315 [Gemmataceae bacterium]